MTNNFLLKHKDVLPKQYGDYMERSYPVSVVQKLMEQYQTVLQKTCTDGWNNFEGKTKPRLGENCIIYNQYGVVHDAIFQGDTNLFILNGIEYRAELWMPIPFNT